MVSAGSSLTVTGQLACASQFRGTPTGGALWTLLAYMELYFQCDEPFAYSLTVSNFQSLAPFNSTHLEDTFVGLQDGLGAVKLAFGESEYWGASPTNFGTHTVSGVLPVGACQLRAIAGDVFDDHRQGLLKALLLHVGKPFPQQ
jgi:hypothetical protein